MPQNVERNYSSSENSEQEIERKNSLFSDIREEKSDDNLDREMEKNTCEYSDSNYSEPEIIKAISSSSDSSSDKSDDDDNMNWQLLGRKFLPNDAPNDIRSFRNQFTKIPILRLLTRKNWEIPRPLRLKIKIRFMIRPKNVLRFSTRLRNQK